MIVITIVTLGDIKRRFMDAIYQIIHFLPKLERSHDVNKLLDQAGCDGKSHIKQDKNYPSLVGPTHFHINTPY